MKSIISFAVALFILGLMSPAHAQVAGTRSFAEECPTLEMNNAQQSTPQTFPINFTPGFNWNNISIETTASGFTWGHSTSTNPAGDAALIQVFREIHLNITQGSHTVVMSFSLGSDSPQYYFDWINPVRWHEDDFYNETHNRQNTGFVPGPATLTLSLLCAANLLDPNAGPPPYPEGQQPVPNFELDGSRYDRTQVLIRPN